MKCRKQPVFLKNTPAHIENIWEVRIDGRLWEKVVQYSNQYNLTFSWIVRYCIFSLLRHKSLRMSFAMEKLSREIKENQPRSGDCHRHMLCLYGDDEKLLRMAAMKLGITVSHLIRLALALYLRYFELDSRLRSLHQSPHDMAELHEIQNTARTPQELKKTIGNFYLSKIGHRSPRALDFHSIFWYGIKLTKAITQNAQFEARLPSKITFNCARFALSDWFALRYGKPSPEYPLAA